MVRKEDPALLSGRGRFADDLPIPVGTLQAHVIRSPHAHAVIRRIDVAAALALPGVAAVITGDDIAKLTEDMSGQGFSANSPILSALRVGIQGQGLRASIQAETQIRLDAAKLNADATHEGQVAVSDQFLKQEGVLNETAKTEVTRTVGILNAVCGLIGSAI